jgi:lipopolysaccharide biosynthesis regulator YciM
MGETELQRGKIDDAVGLFHEAIELSDGYSMRACDMLRRVYERLGDTTKAGLYLDMIREKNRL